MYLSVREIFNKTKQNYSTIGRELFAIVFSIQFFRSYIYDRKFILVTDHQPLKWLHSVKDRTLRLATCVLSVGFKLAEYEYEVIYRAGKINANTDVLSRNPISVLRISSILKNHYSPSKILTSVRSFKDDIITDNGLEEARSDINIQSIKTRN